MDGDEVIPHVGICLPGGAVLRLGISRKEVEVLGAGATPRFRRRAASGSLASANRAATVPSGQPTLTYRHSAIQTTGIKCSQVRNRKPEEVRMDPNEGMERFAATISKQQMGLVKYRPEPSAQPTQCFANVMEKVRRDGGRGQTGWTFHYRIRPNVGGYLFVTHHAVWYAPDGQLFDVTPFTEDEKHHPHTADGDVLFLVDDAAAPVSSGNMLIPLPLRFFPLEDSAELVSYVEGLNRRDREQFEKLRAGDLTAAGAPDQPISLAKATPGRPVEYQISFVVAPDQLLEQADEILRANIRATNANRSAIRRVAKAYIDEADELKRAARDIAANNTKVQLESRSPPEMIELARGLVNFVLPNKRLEEKIRAVAKSYVAVAEKNIALFEEFKARHRDQLPPAV